MKKLLGLLAVAPLTATACFTQVEAATSVTAEEKLVEGIQSELLGEQTLDSIKTDLTLPVVGDFAGETVALEWTSSNEAVVRNDGEVIRPKFGELDEDVSLTIDWTVGNVDYDATVELTVMAITDTFATFNFIDSFGTHIFSDEISWDTDLSGETPRLFDVAEMGSDNESEVVILDGKVDRMFGFGLDHTADAYWEVSTDGVNFDRIDTLTDHNMVIEGGAEYSYMVSADTLNTMRFEVIGYNEETDEIDNVVLDQEYEISAHKSIYGQATAEYRSYGNETLAELIYRHQDEMRVSCNAEGYPSGVEGHDFGCFYSQDGLGKSMRGIAGVGSSWSNSYISFWYNGSYAGVGMSTKRAEAGDHFRMTWATWMNKAEQWAIDTQEYNEAWELYQAGTN